jgi:hypothetical protein
MPLIHRSVLLPNLICNPVVSMSPRTLGVYSRAAHGGFGIGTRHFTDAPYSTISVPDRVSHTKSHCFGPEFGWIQGTEVIRHTVGHWFPKSAVVPAGEAVGLSQGALTFNGAPEVVPLSYLRVYAIQVTSDETLGQWYHLIKPIYAIKNLLTLK